MQVRKQDCFLTAGLSGGRSGQGITKGSLNAFLQADQSSPSSSSLQIRRCLQWDGWLVFRKNMAERCALAGRALCREAAPIRGRLVCVSPSRRSEAHTSPGSAAQRRPWRCVGGSEAPRLAQAHKAWLSLGLRSGSGHVREVLGGIPTKIRPKPVSVCNHKGKVSVF